MGFSSISEVGNHIVSILRRELVPDVVLHTGAIGMCSPEDHGDFTIGVYLYDISPNNDLVERRMAAIDRRTQVFPSTFLTLRYIITAYSMGDLKFRTEEEHRILGRVVQALADYSVIGRTSSLYGKPMDTRIDLERIEPGEKIKLWTFPNKAYRLSLFYKAQPVEITSTRTRLIASRVRDVNVFIRDILGSEMDTLSFGRTMVVLCTDAKTGRPVEGSDVRVVMDHARHPILKEDCYRIFTNIEGDKTVIHCRSQLYKQADIEVDFREWDGSEVYEIQLEPGEHYPKEQSPLSFDEGNE
ncbi:MAG: DUF4255 domain-containing protein [Lachnospiraceae bacterium]|nr:DUF4255 domain-containing protein [Lachnospiraceae bacterium]